MDASRWGTLDYETEVAWLAERDPNGHTTGFDAGGWEASTWVLNSIWRCDAPSPVPTYDEARRTALRLGIAQPQLIGDINLDEITTSTGVGLGFARRPTDPRWRRIRWSDLAADLDVTFDDKQYPPSYQWFPYRSWPVNIQPPTEGSLDEMTFDALVPHLVSHAGADECIATYGIVAASLDAGPRRCLTGPISHLFELIERRRPGTPSNFWPPDRAWMVWTDWDLSATKVSGTPELIADLEVDPDLETISWQSRTS